MLRSSSDSRRSPSINTKSSKRLSLNDDIESEDETTGLLPASNRLYGHVNHNYEDSILENSVEVEVNDDLSSATQSSIVTIFSMWNTMMGTSLLTMPWAIKQAGFANGIVLLLAMTAIMTYTSYRVIVSVRSVTEVLVSEFSDVVRVYFGRVAEAVALLCSVVTLLGGCVVYWILMSNFLYHIVVFIYTKINHDSPQMNDSYSSHRPFDDVLCKNETTSYSLPESFNNIWSETLSVPLFLVILVFPLINFKSPTFFTKFNSFGTVSVAYLLIFLCVKAGRWGFHVNMNPEDSDAPDYTANFKWTFPALTGVAALALFLQNAVITIVRNQKHPENNTRDLIIAYLCVCFTYTFVGAIFYTTFPLAKSCIGDNLLDNLSSNDVMSFIARIGLFCQMTCVLPLLFYVMRTQVLQFLFSSIWPSFRCVALFNLIIVGVCILFAIFLPNIGNIISFVGAFCGLSYAIAMPCGVYMMSCYREGTLTTAKLIFHGFLIVIGVVNFIVQFIVTGDTS